MIYHMPHSAIEIYFRLIQKFWAFNLKIYFYLVGIFKNSHCQNWDRTHPSLFLYSHKHLLSVDIQETWKRKSFLIENSPNLGKSQIKAYPWFCEKSAASFANRHQPSRLGYLMQLLADHFRSLMVQHKTVGAPRMNKW